MISYSHLRKLVQDHPKYPGTVSVERAPLINDGFLGTFNLSFTEHPWLREFGRYIDFDHDFNFSVVQSCIRPNDIPLLRTVDSWRYLGVFEMSDIGGIKTFAKKPDYEKLQREQVKSLIDFLKSVGISPEYLHPVYCAGGSVRELTKGKYDFDFQIPEDKISKNAFLENGVPEYNLIPNKTRDAFLALHVYNKASPWGYRNEINLNLGDRESPDLIDIATLEYGLWRPIFKKGDETKADNTIGLIDSSEGFLITVFGLERLCMVIHGLPSVRDVDYIAPIYDEYVGSVDKSQDELAIESLRALHRLFSDINYFNITPGRHQKKKIRAILQNLPRDLSEEKIKYLLQIHTETQPWHPEMKNGIEPTIERIRNYRNAK